MLLMHTRLVAVDTPAKICTGYKKKPGKGVDNIEVASLCTLDLLTDFQSPRGLLVSSATNMLIRLAYKELEGLSSIRRERPRIICVPIMRSYSPSTGRGQGTASKILSV